MIYRNRLSRGTQVKIFWEPLLWADLLKVRMSSYKVSGTFVSSYPKLQHVDRYTSWGFLHGVITQDLRSAGMLRSVDWWLVTNVSGHHIVPIFNSQELCAVTYQNGTDLTSTGFGRNLKHVMTLNFAWWQSGCSMQRDGLTDGRTEKQRSYEAKSFNNRNAILKCMKKYAQRKILFRDTKWLLTNMSHRGRDDQAVWACAVDRTTWPLHCQLAPWKNNEALFVFCGQRVWNLLKSTEEWRFSMETVVWVRGECMNGWKDFKTDDKMSVMNTGVGDQLAWQVRQCNSRSSFFLDGIHKACGQVEQVCCEAGDYVEK